MSGASNHGRFVWFDLMTSDPDAAPAFYRAVAGWETTPWEGGDMPYQMWKHPTAAMAHGGVMELPEDARAAGAPPHWLAYIGTDDIDATVARATELGGTVMHPRTDIPNAGSFAVLADPQGAVFAVYSGGDTDAPEHAEGPPTVGSFSWHELATTDFEDAFHFYSDLFGWHKNDAVDMGEHGTYQLYGRGEFEYGGMFNKTEDMPGPTGPPAWQYYISVEDVNTAVETVKELGGQVLMGPHEVPDGDLIAQCQDPQGAFFAVHSRGPGQPGQE